MSFLYLKIEKTVVFKFIKLCINCAIMSSKLLVLYLKIYELCH